MNCDASGLLRKRSMLWQHNIGIRPPHGFETQVLVCFSITAPSRKINTSFFRPVADLEEGLVKQLPDEQATARPKVFALIFFFFNYSKHLADALIRGSATRQSSALQMQSHFWGRAAADDGLLQRLNLGYHGLRLASVQLHGVLTALASADAHKSNSNLE